MRPNDRYDAHPEGLGRRVHRLRDGRQPQEQAHLALTRQLVQTINRVELAPWFGHRPIPQAVLAVTQHRCNVALVSQLRTERDERGHESHRKESRPVSLAVRLKEEVSRRLLHRRAYCGQRSAPSKVRNSASLSFTDRSWPSRRAPMGFSARAI